MFANHVSYYNPKEEDSLTAFRHEFLHLLSTKRKDNQPIVFICIGTDRATGDCLGPIVGHLLHEFYSSYFIFGSLFHPVHAKNLEDTILSIYKIFDNPFIIAIDACLGIKQHVGLVTLSPRPLFPGQGVSKNLPPVGNLSITGIVNSTSHSGIDKIQSARLHLVMELASYICNGITYGLRL